MLLANSGALCCLLYYHGCFFHPLFLIGCRGLIEADSYSFTSIVSDLQKESFCHGLHFCAVILNVSGVDGKVWRFFSWVLSSLRRTTY